jgi:dipeptidyl aminopeptidase/acylaminoacyl peptidase
LRLAQRRLGLALNERQVLRANFVDSAGAALASAVNLTWTSAQPGIAEVGADGTVTGRGYGRTRVVATAPGGSADTALVFVQGELLVASTRARRFQLYALERANLGQLRRVSADSGAAYDPSYSPDGSRIAYVSPKDGNPEVYVMDADGGNVTRLTDAPAHDGRPVFSADGRTVIFESARTRNRQIWSAGVDGTNLRQLTHEPATNVQPTVSPDGSMVAFSSTRDGNYDIWLMAPDGSQQRAFIRSTYTKESHPRFLRDGTLAYLTERQEGTRTVTQVFRADLTTGETTPLTGTDLQITAFDISPAGDLLALVVPVPGSQRQAAPLYRVYVQPVGGGGPVPIPAGAEEQIVSPAFQP